jgi:uncharacterized damage-inducible protein DinB
MDLLDRLLGHDEWTTGELLRRCAELTESQMRQRFDIGMGSLHKTLVHMITDVRIWADLISTGSTDGATSAWHELDLAGLSDAHTTSYAAFAEIARRVQAENRINDVWVDLLGDPPTAKTFGGAILHVITHNMHHRAQMLNMLSRLGLRDLPEGDLLSWEAFTTAKKGVMNQ